METIDLVYARAADSAGLPLAVSLFGDRAYVLAEMAGDVEGAGLTLREAASLAALGEAGEGAPRVLGEIVLVDCPQLRAAELAALTRLDARAARAGARLIVATSAAALEDVFGCCAQSEPQILVNPRPADRIVALGCALADRPASRVRELSEDDRLALLRLTQQVGEIAQRLDGRDAAAGGAALPPGLSAFAFSNRDPARGDAARAARPALPDARLVRRIIRQRQLRGRFFDGGLFADPAWDMLLDLTAARVEQVRVSVTSLCIASGVPPTTALRWISQMTAAGLFQRVEDDTDRRRAFIELTDRAVDAMARYFHELGHEACQLA